MILVRLLGLLFDLLLFPLRAFRRSRAVPAGSFLALTIDGAVADILAPRPFWEFRPYKATSLLALSEVIDAMIPDDRIRGLIVTIKHLGAGMATSTSLRTLLARARAAGKEVVVHLPLGGGTKEVYVASAANKIFVGPAAQLAPFGFLSSTRYLKGALEKAGVEPEVFACGEYKSAGETFVRDSMSEPQREQLGRLLDGFHRAVVDGIAEGRDIPRERAEALVDGAPYFGEAGVAAGIADGIAYEDQVPELLGLGEKGLTSDGQKEEKGKKGHRSRFLVDSARYLAMVKRPLVRRLGKPPVIAVLPVHGPIAHASVPFGGKVATDESVARMARHARLDPRVVGVVLHVDSPGGSALASDRMHHEIVQLAREKPLVVCMANVAASGGYYVAAPAHRVVCERTSVTGSIGVVAARMSIQPLLRRLGVVTETVRRGERAGLLSPSLPLSDDERAAVSRELDATYKCFVGVVARGRKMPESDVEPLARGRVYTGEDALANGLVDRLGGFDVALEELRKLLPTEVRATAMPSVLRTPKKPLRVPEPPTEGEAGRRALEAFVAELLPAPERALLKLGASGERVLALWLGDVP